ncbi:MAG: hypothetical protein JJ992_22430 [Planctomycetes bacterium]|jgi:hypothetical protein|nr:hypothetical protein [Planctomycetota bacterium]
MNRQCVTGLAAAAFAALLGSGSAALAQTMTTVECGEVNVILNDEQTAAIKEKTGEDTFGTQVCDVARKIDASGYAEPTPVTITMPSGESYDVKLQAVQ